MLEGIFAKSSEFGRNRVKIRTGSEALLSQILYLYITISSHTCNLLVKQAIVGRN